MVSGTIYAMPVSKMLVMAMTVIAACLGAAGLARSGVEGSPEVCDRPEDCQRLFEAQRRDEPWSSRLEDALRAFLAARPELSVRSVECRTTLCSITAVTSGPDIHPWAMAMIEMHAMPWYADFYGDSGTGSGPKQVEVSPGLWRPDPAGVVTIWWFLERKPAAVQP
jgi:hypothetical protein